MPLVLGLERECGLVSRYETVVRPRADADTLRYVERIVKFLLWARGGWKLHFGGPKAIGEFIRKTYSPRGRAQVRLRDDGAGLRQEIPGRGRPRRAKFRRQQEMQVAAGGHLKGCRIGFDLGASDYKVSAVDGRRAGLHRGNAVGSRRASRIPEYHYHHISAALHRAAAHLPRVDAIGGSSAGIIVDNEIRVASLLRSIPEEGLSPKAAGVFKRIQKEWGVPLVVMNDGDVTALAGALSLRQKGMLGIAMGSSEAGGFMDKRAASSAG